MIIKNKWNQIKCKHTYHTSINQIAEFKLLIQNECRLCHKIKKQTVKGESSGFVGDTLNKPSMIAFPTTYIFSKNLNNTK